MPDDSASIFPPTDPSARSGTRDAGRPPTIAIVGGGLAGMAAALGLRQVGCAPLILEAKTRLGGRVGSFSDEATGQEVDYCQHVGMGCCTHLLAFLEALGISQAWNRERTLHFYTEGGGYIPVKGMSLPAPLHLAGLLVQWPGLDWKDRVSIARGLSKLMRLEPSAELDRIPALTWLEKMPQSPKAISRFWETILVSAVGDQLHRVSLGNAHKVLVEGFAAHRDAYHLLVPQQPMSRMIADQGLQALRDQGIGVRLSAVVRRLVIDEGRIQGVELASGERIRADATLVCIPWYRWKSLLEADDMAVVSRWFPPSSSPTQIESSPITGVHTWWDRAWLETPHAILIHRLCQWVFPHPTERAGSRDGSCYYQIVISGSRTLPQGDPTVVLDSIVQDLKEVFPLVSAAKLVRGRVVTDRNAVFSISPDQFQLRPAVDAMAPHRLWLAGDWTQSGWPATMEGALRSGFLAANSIAGHLGKPLLAPIPDLPQSWLVRRFRRGFSWS